MVKTKTKVILSWISNLDFDFKDGEADLLRFGLQIVYTLYSDLAFSIPIPIWRFRSRFCIVMDTAVTNEVKVNNLNGNIASTGQLPPKSTVCKRKKSDVWEHFEEFQIEGEPKASCLYCKKIYRANSKRHGTSTLRNHLHSCPKYPYKEQLKGQATLGFKPKKIGEEGGQLVTLSFNQEDARKALAEMIIIDELPFRFVENYGFRRFCIALQPKWLNISRYTIARDIMKIFDVERENLRKLLKGRRICLTTDTWTSIQNLNYMCLTCHFVNDDWKLEKRILNFCIVNDHKGETIGKKIEQCLLEWGIEGFFTLTVDNASSNNLTIKFLQKVTKNWKGTILGHELLHMRCCAHILNLIVVEGLKDLDDSIQRVRGAVRYVKSSPSRFQSFLKCVNMLKIESKSLLCLDVPTRWNSTYKMLDSAGKFEKAFERLDVEDPRFRAYFLEKDMSDITGSPPNDEDWVRCRAFVKFLKLFYEATKRFSGTLYVTSNSFFDEIFIIRSAIDRLILVQDNGVAKMAMNMKSKFDKYWGNGDKINVILYVAVLLDPRKKLSYLQFCFSKMYTTEIANLLIDNVKFAINRLYECYSSMELMSTHVETRGGSGPNESGSGDVTSTSIMDLDIMDENPHMLIASQFESFMEGKIDMGGGSEVEKYLSELPERTKDENFDILDWWKVNCSRYKVLALVARDVLAVPVSTVASESAFSTGGRILDPFRSSLSPQMVERLVCAQNWLLSSVPISLRNIMDEVEEFEKDIEPVLDQSASSSTSGRSSTITIC